MTEPNLDKIDKILKDVMDDATLWYIGRITEEEYWSTHRVASEKISKLIANQVREARIEEAKLFNRYFDDNQAFKGFAEERLKELGE